MYHGSCPLLFSTRGSAGRSGSRSLFFNIFNLRSIGFIHGKLSGAMEHRQLAVWIFMHPNTGFDVVVPMAICGYLKTPVFVANGVVFSDHAFFLHT